MTVQTTVEHGLAWVRFGTGERGNAMTAQVRTDLRATLTGLGEDRTVRAVVLAGTGKHFCAGQDLHAHHAALRAESDAIAGSTRREFAPIIELLATMPKPVIACLHGAVAGAGLGLALASDLRIASPSVRFSTAFASVGLGPDSGVSFFLPRLIGMGRATDALLRPRVIDAEEAARIGLVHETAAPVESRVREVAEELAAGPTFAYAAIKATLLAGQTGLPEALETEAVWQEQAARTHDHRSAVGAFVNNAAPTYRGS